MRQSYRLALIGFLWLSPALGPYAAAPALAATGASAAIGVATFDPERTTIAVPYEGPAPRVEFYRLSSTHFYYEFRPARLARGGVQHQLIGDTLVRYTMANRPTYEGVRLSFVLTRPGVPTYRLDEARRLVVILPLGREAVTRVPGSKAPAPAVAAAPTRQTPSPKPTPVAPARQVAASPAPRLPVSLPFPTPSPSRSPEAAAAAPRRLPRSASKPTPKALPSVQVKLPQQLTPPSRETVTRTEIGRPYLDDFHHRMVLPFSGPAPNYTIRVYDKNPRWIYLEFEQSSAKLDEPCFDNLTDPVFEGWMLTEHEGKPRLYLKFKVQSPVSVQVYAESGEIWFTAPPRD